MYVLIAQLARKYKMSKKEYEHGDHMAVMSELLTLYKLRNEKVVKRKRGGRNSVLKI